MSTAVKRACDACHRRKVKCDGVNPCRNCSSAQLCCTYNAIPQKKGPKGSRAKVISELRETQRQSSLSAKLHNRMAAPPGTVSLAPSPGLLTNDIVRASLDFFFAHMYPSMPILNRQRLEHDALSTDTTLDTYCLLAALAAFMMMQPGMALPGTDPYGPEPMHGTSLMTASLLLEETLRVRKGYDYAQNPSLYTVATSYFVFACYYTLDLHNKAWLHLREATTLAHLASMHKDDAYATWDTVDAARRRRLYWLLFVAERAYALQHDRPLSLRPAAVAPPTAADDPSDPAAPLLAGFFRLAAVFRPFDAAFVDLWNAARADSSSPVSSGAYMTALQKQHNDRLAAAAAADPQFTDCLRNHQWLQTLIWQINLVDGPAAATTGVNVSGVAADVARELTPMISAFSSAAFSLSPSSSSSSSASSSITGVATSRSNSIPSKLFETLLTITNDLMDLLALLPSASRPFTVTPRDHLNQLSGILALLRSGQHQFAPLLFTKVHEILPRLANPQLQNAPENLSGMDIFDGLGNAGMAQPPCLPMEDFKAESSSNSANGSASLNDVTSPFVSSPPLMSPGADFGHTLPAEYAAISDLGLHNQSTIASLGPGANIHHHMPSAQTPPQLVLQSRQPDTSQPQQQQQIEQLQQQQFQRQQQHQHHQSQHQQHQQHRLHQVSAQQQPQLQLQQHQPQHQQHTQHQQLHQHQHHQSQSIQQQLPPHLSQQLSQQRPLPQQALPQLQQHPHPLGTSQQHAPVPLLQNLDENMAHNISLMQSRMAQPMNSPPLSAISQSNQPLESTQNMADVLNSQAFNTSISAFSPSLDASIYSLRQPPPSAAGFGLPPQQLRPVDSFQPSQRANSDVSSLNQLDLSSMGTGVDFTSLR